MLSGFETAAVLILGTGYISLFLNHFQNFRVRAYREKENLNAALKRIHYGKQELHFVEESCTEVEKELEEVRIVYQSLKQMQEVLEFAQTIEIFCKGLHHWYPFQKGIIALAEGNIYEIRFSSLNENPELELKNKDYAPKAKEVLKEVKHLGRPVQLKEERLFGHKAIVLPLFLQGGCLGFLALELEEEGAGAAQLEKGMVYDILIHEFTLEISKKMFYEKVKALSVSDSLTGAFLRKYFFLQMEKELQRCRTSGTEFSLLMVDIDSFKKVNDLYGHLAGDELLVKVAQILKENSREIDLLGRFGGDEFVLMLPGAGTAEAETVMDRIQKITGKSGLFFSNEKLVPSLSIGWASFPKDGEDIDALLSCADKKLYENKNRVNK